jgi:hypothetical protein
LQARTQTLRRWECARRIAEAQVDLNRVRNYRRRLIAGLLIDPNYRPQRALSEQLRLMKLIDRVERMRWAPPEVKEFLKMAQPPEGEAKFAAIVEERAAPLAAIDRYERRAWSRRKFAIRNFDTSARHSRSRLQRRSDPSVG